jgi:peptide/nickel transport system permease protein
MSFRALGLLLAKILAALLAVLALGAEFFSPNPPATQNLEQFFAPPTRIHFVDREGRFHFRPFIYRYELTDPLNVSYQERTDSARPLEFFVKGHPYKILGWTIDRHLIGVSGGGGFYPLGTDGLGRDVLARVMAGARTSLAVLLLGVWIYALLGITIGMLAGMLGGRIDSLLMRFSEFVMALPALYLILALRAVLPLRLPYWQTLLLTVGTIAAVTWPPMARGVRGLILQLQSARYVEAARSLGSTRGDIFRRHMLPALGPFVFTQAALATPTFVLGEVMLSFLGAGSQGTDESWGSMLQSALDPRVVTDFWWNLAPLAFVFATLLCLNVLGNRLGRKEFTPLA